MILHYLRTALLMVAWVVIGGTARAESGEPFGRSSRWKWPTQCVEIKGSPTHSSPIQCLPFPSAAGGLNADEVGRLQQFLRHEGVWGDGPRNRLGVALSGGGTRAASVAMGVLGQLHYSGILKQIDAISSVSGGGYAAYFLFNRLATAEPGSRLDAYSDMVWRAYTVGLAPPADGRRDRNEGLRLRKKFRFAWSERFGEKAVNPDVTSQLTACDVFARSDNRALGDSAGGQCSARGAPADHARDQLHVSSWRDILADSQALPEILSDADQSHKGQWLSELGLFSLLTSIPHNLLNTLFDWRVNASSSRERYRAGIHRTYGVVPSSRKDACMPTAPEEREIDKMDLPGDEKKLPRLLDIMCMYADGLDFPQRAEKDRTEQVRERLAHLSDRMWFAEIERRQPPLRLSQLATKPGTPLWVINASIGKGGVAIDLASRKEDSYFERNFEFTPFSFGAGELGFVPVAYDANSEVVIDAGENAPGVLPGRFTALDAVTTSAGFLDPTQQKFGTATKVFLGAGMHVLNAKWGMDIPNFRLPDWRRQLHRALPFPFYWLDGYFPGTESPFLHLSDGGHASDNLGIYALLRRGVNQIIAVDATYDREGKLDDLCYLRSNLKRHHQICLEVEGEDCDGGDKGKAPTTLTMICGKSDDVFVVEDNNGGRRRLSPFLMKQPIIKLRAAGFDERIVSGGSASIYLLKMSVDWGRWFPEEDGGIPSSSSGVEPCADDLQVCEKFETVMQQCTAPFLIDGLPNHSFPESGAAPGLPCNVALFQALNWGPGARSSGWRIDSELAADGTVEQCWRPSFPQHATESSTLNGSRRTYYAYRDLGAYLARGLSWKDNIVKVAPWAENKQPILRVGICSGSYFPKSREECMWCGDRRPLA